MSKLDALIKRRAIEAEKIKELERERLDRPLGHVLTADPEEVAHLLSVKAGLWTVPAGFIKKSLFPGDLVHFQLTGKAFDKERSAIPYSAIKENVFSVADCGECGRCGGYENIVYGHTALVLMPAHKVFSDDYGVKEIFAREDTFTKKLTAIKEAMPGKAAPEELFPDRLRRLRKAAGLTQEEVARALSVKNTTISSWESGRTEPPVMTIPKLARMYHVSSDKLLTGTE